MNVEAGNGYDVAAVDVSANQGLTYTTMEANGNGLTNNTAGVWVSNSISLAQLAGSNVLVRFRFDTVDSYQNDGEGWYLDDIVIHTAAAAPVVLSPTNSGAFTNGLWSGALTISNAAGNVVLRADASRAMPTTATHLR